MNLFGLFERRVADALGRMIEAGDLPGGLDVEITSGHLSIPAWGLRIAAAGLDAATAGAAVEVLAAADAEGRVRLLHTVAHRAREPEDPAEDLHGGGVEVGPDRGPLLDDRVDRVLALCTHAVSIRPVPVTRKKVA